MKRIIIIFCVPLFLAACSGTDRGDRRSDSDDNIVREYYASGNVKTEITVLDSLRHGPTKNYDQEGNLIGIRESDIVKFNTADYVFILSFARELTDKISYGVNVKMIYRDYYTESAQGIGFDIGAINRISPSLRNGLMLRDITTTMMAWSTSNKEFIAPSIRPGISYLYNINSICLFYLFK